MKDLKDYLHLYLGCEVQCDNKDCYGDLERYGMKSNNVALLLRKHLNGNWKPILRPLSDMTQEEKRKLSEQPEDVFEAAEEVRYLLSKHFDLFGLIEAGLAIDKTTLTK